MNHFLHHHNLSLSEAHFKTIDASWSRKDFVYPHNRLYYVTDGEAKLVMTDRCVYLKKGYLYLLPAFMMVETICTTSLSHHYVHFHIDSLDFLTYLTYDLPNFHHIPQDPQFVTALFESIETNYLDNSIAGTLKNQGSLQLLLAPFFNDYDPMKSTHLQRFEPILRYIDEHLHEPIVIDELARIISLEKVYFSNLFASTFGIPPRQYIIKTRLNRAQRLLTTTDKRVKEIALEVGFENESYFSRLFHAKIGQSPGGYRRSI